MWKNCIFKWFLDFEQKNWNNYTKNTRRIVKTHLKVFRGTVLGRFFGMKKLYSTFLVVEWNYWIFGVNFLSNFSKLQPTRAADCFEALLERSVILWSFLVSERNLPNFGKKIRQVANFHFTCTQQNFEKKWLKYFSLLSSLLDFQWIFFWFWRKKLVRCVGTVI